jgi:hypothetical protein
MNDFNIGDKFRHKKRGSVYTIVGVGTLQTEWDDLDNEGIVIYEGVSGHKWVRPTTEFFDGRFEKV